MSNSERGVSLVEVMISLVVLLLVSLALMQTALVSIDANSTNTLRDEAVKIAAADMTEARNVAYAALISVPVRDVRVPIRNIPDFLYKVTRTVTDEGSGNKQITVTVTWDWKESTLANGNPYTHTIVSMVRE